MEAAGELRIGSRVGASPHGEPAHPISRRPTAIAGSATAHPFSCRGGCAASKPVGVAPPEHMAQH
jgi:hypothetical protein